MKKKNFSHFLRAISRVCHNSHKQTRPNRSGNVYKQQTKVHILSFNAATWRSYDAVHVRSRHRRNLINSNERFVSCSSWSFAEKKTKSFAIAVTNVATFLFLSRVETTRSNELCFLFSLRRQEATQQQFPSVLLVPGGKRNEPWYIYIYISAGYTRVRVRRERSPWSLFHAAVLFSPSWRANRLDERRAAIVAPWSSSRDVSVAIVARE